MIAIAIEGLGLFVTGVATINTIVVAIAVGFPIVVVLVGSRSGAMITAVAGSSIEVNAVG